MKIHYKTIIRKTECLEIIIRTAKGVYSPRKIDYCCKEMKSAVTDDILYIQEVGNNVDKNGIGLFLKNEDSYEGGMSVWYCHPLKLCPFCGEKITLIEDYKAKEAVRKVHIPAKTIPACHEMRTYEIKV